VRLFCLLRQIWVISLQRCFRVEEPAASVRI
jgi:hypothetical protein